MNTGMTQELQSAADELIRALGMLGVAQERRSSLEELSATMQRTVDLMAALADSGAQVEDY